MSHIFYTECKALSIGSFPAMPGTPPTDIQNLRRAHLRRAHLRRAHLLSGTNGTKAQKCAPHSVRGASAQTRARNYALRRRSTITAAPAISANAPTAARLRTFWAPVLASEPLL